MKAKAFGDLGQLQRAVLETVWDLGEADVHQVRDHVNGARKTKLAYTTVLSAMQKLEKGGWLSHRAKGRSYVYMPKRSREEAGAGSVRQFLRRVFDGDAIAMFQHLIRESNLSDLELGTLREMIEEKRKERRS